MGRLDGKIAFITGGARGQGRSHAVRMAQEGADIIACDICGPVETTPIEPATRADLDETKALVEAEGRRIAVYEADVRDSASLDAAVAAGTDEIGPIDVVVANAGIWSIGESWTLDEATWQQMIDVNLSGVWRTVKATVPGMLERNRGGSVILTSSMCGLAGFYGLSHYVAAKHGVVGMMKVLVQEVGHASIRVNSVCPTNVMGPMFDNEFTRGVFVPGTENVSDEEFLEATKQIHPLPVGWVEAIDVSHAVVFLASDESRYVTGVPLLIDAGCLSKPA